MSGLISQVPDPAPSAGAGWLATLRHEAAAYLHARGFPGKKHEAWRFTSVREIVETTFAPEPAERAAPAALDALGDDGTWRVAIAAGRPWLDGAGAAPDGVTVESLADALARDPAALEGQLGAGVAAQDFAALNAALFTDGLVVRIRAGADVTTPLHVVHVATPGEAPRAAYPRVLVLAEPGSRACVVESFVAAPGGSARHLTNVVTEVAVGANAHLEHVRVTEGTDRTVQLASLGVRLARDARYASRVVTLGGALSRLDLFVRFEGAGAEALLDGVYHVDGQDHVDHHVRVDHVAGHGTSRTRYRGLADGRGHAVFDAIGVVHRGAAGSAVHQENRNLLLSDAATVHTKPHLEIDEDDVAASHGATVGALDEAQLFYLRARAVPLAEARSILTFAFARAVLDGIGHAPLVARTSEALLSRLPEGAALRGGLSA